MAQITVLEWIGIAIDTYSIYQYLFSKTPSTNYKYTDGALASKVDSNACIPVIYGEVKSAGNLLWTDISDDNKTLYKMISFCEGQISGFSDIRFNDLAYTYYGDNAGVTTYVGDGVQLIDNVIAGTQIEKARVVGGLKNEAYIVAWAKACEDLSGDYSVTALVKGKLIRVFSKTAINGYNYDSTLGLYYTLTWSNNPIWCLLDFLVDYNGAGVLYSDIDIDSFITYAPYCDEAPITGGQSHRFTLNIRIDEKKSKLDWIKEIMMTCQAYPTYNNGKFGIMIEKTEEVSQVFKPKDINELNIWWSPLNEIADIARIGYTEPQSEWTKIYAEAESDTPLRTPPFISDLDIVGVTNFNQASRLAWFYLNQSVTCTMYASFKTDRRALNRSIGEVIELQDEYITSLVEYGRNGKRFRIYQKSENSDGTIELQVREYNAYLYNDELGSAPPTINVSKLPSAFTTPPDILGFENGIEQVYYVQKDKTAVSYIKGTCLLPNYIYYYQLRIFYSLNDGDWIEQGTCISGQFTINNAKVGSNYRVKVLLENKYGLRSKGYVSDAIYITGKNEPPSPVTNLVAVETNGGFTLTWNPCSDPDTDGYNIYEGLSPDDTYLVSKDYSGTSYTYSTTRTGQFIFFVRSIDTSGNISSAVSVIVSIIPPQAVENFDVYQNGRDLDFRWTQNENERVKVGYEIRKGESWDLSEIIGRVNGSSMKISYYSTAYSHKFWIKAISMYGVYSDEASYATIDIAPLANRNVILAVCPTDTKPSGDWNSSRINLNVIDGGLELKSNVMRGEQVQHVVLPEVYNARNWIDSKIVAVSNNFVTWEQANFAWNDLKASSMWIPLGKTVNAYITHQLARKSTEIDTAIIESIPLNNSLIAEKGSTVSKQIKPSYASGRYFNGLSLNDLTYTEWNVSVPLIFSHYFQVRLTNGLPYPVIFATLAGSGGKLYFGYDSILNSFYLSDLGNQWQYVSIPFNTQDYITFAVSQGENIRRFFVASFTNRTSNFIMDEKSFSPKSTFTKYSLYGNI